MGNTQPSVSYPAKVADFVYREKPVTTERIYRSLEHLTATDIADLITDFAHRRLREGLPYGFMPRDEPILFFAIAQHVISREAQQNMYGGMRSA